MKAILPSNTEAISTSPSRSNYLRNAHLVSFSLNKKKSFWAETMAQYRPCLIGARQALVPTSKTERIKKEFYPASLLTKGKIFSQNINFLGKLTKMSHS